MIKKGQDRWLYSQNHYQSWYMERPHLARYAPGQVCHTMADKNHEEPYRQMGRA